METLLSMLNLLTEMRLKHNSGTNRTFWRTKPVAKWTRPIFLTVKWLLSGIVMWWLPSTSRISWNKLIALHTWSVAPLSMIQEIVEEEEAWQRVPARLTVGSFGGVSLSDSFLAVWRVLYWAAVKPVWSASRDESESSVRAMWAANRLCVACLVD